MSIRRAVTIAACAVLLGILAVPLIEQGTSTQLERATTASAPSTTLATGLTKTTRTSQIMTDDETLGRAHDRRRAEPHDPHQTEQFVTEAPARAR